MRCWRGYIICSVRLESLNRELPVTGLLLPFWMDKDEFEILENYLFTHLCVVQTHPDCSKPVLVHNVETNFISVKSFNKTRPPPIINFSSTKREQDHVVAISCETPEVALSFKTWSLAAIHPQHIASRPTTTKLKSSITQYTFDLVAFL